MSINSVSWPWPASLLFSNSNLADEKESLIDLIVWYRDEYHRKDFGHNELIEKVKCAQSSVDLSNIEQVLDLWIDL